MLCRSIREALSLSGPCTLNQSQRASAAASPAAHAEHAPGGGQGLPLLSPALARRQRPDFGVDPLLGRLGQLMRARGGPGLLRSDVGPTRRLQ